jgi:hypothetical protein
MTKKVVETQPKLQEPKNTGTQLDEIECLYYVYPELEISDLPVVPYSQA